MTELELKAQAFDEILKIKNRTDSYWNDEVRSAYAHIEFVVDTYLRECRKLTGQVIGHECIDCENFDLSDNTCLQHNKLCYNINKECMHTGCIDWQQCSGFVPPMNEEEDSE